MKKYLKMTKRWDWIIVFTLILLSFLPYTVFSYQYRGINEDDYDFVAVVSVNNEEVKRITLTGHVGNEIYNIPEVTCDSDSVEVKDGQIRMRSSHCPDQVCVLTGYISRPGQTIICLHHRVIVEIVAVGGNFSEDMIISY